MGKPAKKPVSKSNGVNSVLAQTETSARNQNKATAPASSEEEEIIIESAPAPTPEESNAHAQTDADKNIHQTKSQCKQTDETLDTIKMRLTVTKAELNVVTTVLDTLPVGLEGPLAVMAKQMKRLSVNISTMNQEIINICDVKQKTVDAPPPPSSYCEALKRTGDTVASIQRSLCDDQRHSTFEKDKQKAACSFFIPELRTLLSRVDEDLATTGSTKVAKPTSEIIKSDLHWWVVAKAATHVNDSLLKALPSTPSQLFSKVIIRRNEGKPTSAIVECPSKDLKNIVCRVIRMKLDGRQTRSNPVAP